MTGPTAGAARGSGPQRLSAADMAALTAQLRALAAARAASQSADLPPTTSRHDQHEHAREYGKESASMDPDHRYQLDPDDDWFAGGYDRAHDTYLDELAHVDAEPPGWEATPPPDVPERDATAAAVARAHHAVQEVPDHAATRYPVEAGRDPLAAERARRAQLAVWHTTDQAERSETDSSGSERGRTR